MAAVSQRNSLSDEFFISSGAIAGGTSMAVALAWQQPTVHIGHISALKSDIDWSDFASCKIQSRQKIPNLNPGLTPCAQGVPRSCDTHKRTFFTYAPQLLRPVSPLAVFIRTRLLGGCSLLMQGFDAARCTTVVDDMMSRLRFTSRFKISRGYK